MRRSLTEDAAARAAGRPVQLTVEGCTGWRSVVEEIERAGTEAVVAEPAETQDRRGSKKRGKTDRSDARLLRELTERGEVPVSWRSSAAANSLPQLDPEAVYAEIS